MQASPWALWLRSNLNHCWHKYQSSLNQRTVTCYMTIWVHKYSKEPLFGLQSATRTGEWTVSARSFPQSFHACLFSGILGSLPDVFTVDDVRLHHEEWHTVQCNASRARHIGCSHTVLRSKSLLGSGLFLRLCRSCRLSLREQLSCARSLYVLLSFSNPINVQGQQTFKISEQHFSPFML